MFGIDAPELLVIVIVAIVVIGPKDLPLALRTAGRWIGKMRRVSAHFRSGLDTMIREAEMEEMERKWKEQNEAVMKAHPPVHMEPINAETMAPEGVAVAADAIVSLHDEHAPAGAREERRGGESSEARADHDGVVRVAPGLAVEPRAGRPRRGGGAQRTSSSRGSFPASPYLIMKSSSATL